MQAINFEQNCAPHWGRAQGKSLGTLRHSALSQLRVLLFPQSNAELRGVQRGCCSVPQNIDKRMTMSNMPIFYALSCTLSHDTRSRETSEKGLLCIGDARAMTE
jgi:hypothetical protein